MKALVLLLLISNIAYGADQTETYETAKALADELESNPEYKKHHSEILVPYLSNEYSQELKACFTEVEKPNGYPFNMVIVLDKEGAVKEVFRDRETNVGLCMFEKLERAEFPSPVIAPYYLHIEMKFGK